MDYESEAINFLSQKENLPFVLDIAEKVEKVKAKLHLDFWNCFEGKLQEKLSTPPLSERWILKRDPNVFSHWSGMSLVSIDEPQILQMRLRIEQDSDKLRLFYGLKWCQNNTNAMTTQAVDELERDLKKNRYTNDSPWWLAYKYTDIYPKSHDFWLKVSRSSDIKQMT